MHLIPPDRSAHDVFEFCQRWLACLARKDYEAACGMLVPSEPTPWTPLKVEHLISNYGQLGNPGKLPAASVTPPESAVGEISLDSLLDPDDDEIEGEVHSRYPFAVYWFLTGPSAIGAVGSVRIDYPLDGEWSDLSSEFDIIPQEGGLGFQLERIEIM